MTNEEIENLPEILILSEVAGIIGKSPLTIKRWGKRGKLHPIRLPFRGDRRYFKKEVLSYFLLNV
jgi:predicted site-specific integrase-resolvase